MASVQKKIFGGGGFRDEVDFVNIEYDYSKDGGAVGDLELFEATKACVVHLEHLWVETAVTGSGLSLEVGKNGAGNFAEIAVASLTLDSMHAPTTFTDAYEVTDVTCVADSGGSLNNKYFLLNAASGAKYYVWMNVNAAGVDPAVSGRTGIEVALATNDADTAVATKVRAVIEAHAAFGAAAPVGAKFRITNAVIGPVVDATAGNSGFTVEVITQGSINGVKGVLLAAGDKITQSIRTAAATAGKIKYVLKVLAI